MVFDQLFDLLIIRTCLAFSGGLHANRVASECVRKDLLIDPKETLLIKVRSSLQGVQLNVKLSEVKCFFEIKEAEHIFAEDQLIKDLFVDRFQLGLLELHLQFINRVVILIILGRFRGLEHCGELSHESVVFEEQLCQVGGDLNQICRPAGATVVLILS